MTSKVIQTITGNDVQYKVIKDGYKTITETIHITDDMPTRTTYDLSPSTVAHNPELNYTIDTSHEYSPVITFNENVVTPDDTEITTNKYILAPYGQDYSVVDNQQEDNFTKVGNVQVSKDGIVSGFGPTNSLQLPQVFNPGNNSWEIVLKIKFGSRRCYFFGNTNGTYGIVLGKQNGKLEVFLSSNNSNWNITGGITDVALEDNTEYYIKLSYNLTSYQAEASIDGITWQTSTITTSSEKIYQSIFYLGSCWDKSTAYCDGSIDLSESYIKINNEIWWQPTWNKLSDNYIVGGSVCVNDHIASNLTTWLAPMFTPTTDTWEFTTKIYTGSELTSHQNQILHNLTQGYAMAIAKQGTSGTPMSSYINNTWTNGTTSLSANTWYWFRFSCINKVCRLYITEFDNQSECPSVSNMTLQCTVTASVSFIGNIIVLSVSGDQYWGGQIDLKQTQFIEGDKVWKYKDIYSNNARAYTIGIPNFYEGKLWGFSTNRYVSLPKSWRSTNNWEFVAKFKITSFNVSSVIWHAEIFSNLEIGANTGVLNSYNFQRGQGDSIFTAELDKWYWVKCILNGTTKTYFVSEDGINYQQKVSQTDTSINPSSNYEFRIGLSSYDGSKPFTNGIIDLTGCYLKINDELIWKGSEKAADFLPGILDPNYSDTGDQVTLNLYDVETDKRTLILNNNRDVTVQNKQYVEYNGEITIPDHGLSVYDPEKYTWSKYRIVTLNVNDEDTGIYTEGNI